VAAATYLPISLLEEWTELLNGDTRQALLYGPPGTGKTYVARQLARHLAGSPDRVSFVQFHPSFSYEDFIEGLRPSEAAEGLNYEVRPGLFKEFCRRAAGSDDTFVYVIDEINRADLGSVLGELLMLLEYRGQTIRLPYSQKPFSVPHNIILLATMNTADRSLALVDYALRRRFHAFQMLPNRAILADYLASRDDDVGPALELFDLVQNRVASDEVAPGHSYWMTKDLTATGLDRIWRYQLRPYLSEYWFEHPAQLQRLEADVATLLSEETQVTTVREYDTVTLELDDADLAYLLNLVRGSASEDDDARILQSVTPTTRPGTYELRAGPYVGRLGLPSGRWIDFISRFALPDVIRLILDSERVPIRVDSLAVQAEASPFLVEMIAAAFLRETERLVGAGLLKGYRTQRHLRPPYAGRLDVNYHLAKLVSCA
jgi:DNA polymerase III delta prime subunit